MSIRLSGSVPDPPYPDHSWKLYIGPDGDGDPYVAILAENSDGRGDNSGLRQEPSPS